MLKAHAYLGGLTIIALAACSPGAPSIATAPPSRPAELALPPTYERTDVSFALENYYNGVERNLIVRGLLRDDGGGPDVSFGADDLKRAFNEIVFQQEFIRRGERLIRTEQESRLNRFSAPVRLNLVFGETVDDTRRDADRAEVGRLLRRLGRVSGHPIRQVDDSDSANFTVFVVHEEERVNLEDRLRGAMPELTDQDITAILDMPRTRYCLVVTSDPADDGQLERAIAIVRAEHSERLRVSCLHEEIAQGLGLQNDSPDARPSIFTDEEEFGRLTSMDELLLAMLYDPRLQPGMSAAEAEPILDQIITDLIGPRV